MATNTNNGGGSHNHLSLLLLDGIPYRHMYFSSQEDSGQMHNYDAKKVVLAIVIPILALIIFVICRGVICPVTEEQEEQGGWSDGDNIVRQQQSIEADSSWVDRAPLWTVASASAVEMAQPVRTADEPPLVCSYWKADGWLDGSCRVCLADLVDGEAVRVLPACLHFFHAACVDEWLHSHDTCPLCRVPLVVPPDTT